MATIRKQKNGKWRAEIRQQNNRYLSKTFFNKGSASAWAKDTENKLEKEQSVCIQSEVAKFPKHSTH